MGSLPANPAKIAMATEFVKAAIANDKVVIFSKSYCPYCTMAKEQFKKLNQAFTAIELEKRDDGAEIQAALGEMTGATSVNKTYRETNIIS